MLVIFFNNIDQNMNESYQLKNKDKQNNEKQVQTFFENLRENENQQPIKKAVYHN